MKKFLKTLKNNLWTSELRKAVKEDTQEYLKIPKTFSTIAQAFGKTLDDLDVKVAKEIRIHIGETEYVLLLGIGDKEKAIATAVTWDAMIEPEKKKREMLYSYLNGIINGIHPEFNDHTKLRNAIRDITLEEFDLLILFKDNYKKILKKAGELKNPTTPILYYTKDRGVAINEIHATDAFKDIPERKLEKLATRLGTNFDLIDIGFGRMNGTFYGPLSEFGQIFLDYISQTRRKKIILK
jgi:hypothetical protein